MTNYSLTLEFGDEVMTKSDLLIKMSYFDFFIMSFNTSGKMIIFLLKLLKRNSFISGYVFMFLKPDLPTCSRLTIFYFHSRMITNSVFVAQSVSAFDC